MKNQEIIELLEKRFESFIDEKRTNDFFFGLADYVLFIQKNNKTKEIINSLFEERQSILDEWNIWIKKKKEELKKSQEKLLKIIKENKLNNKDIQELTNSLRSYQSGGPIKNIKLQGKQTQDFLELIIKAIVSRGKEDLVKDFIVSQNGEKRIVVSKSSKKEAMLSRKYSNFKARSTWGCWHRLEIVPPVLIEDKRMRDIFDETGFEKLSAFRELDKALEGPKRFAPGTRTTSPSIVMPGSTYKPEKTTENPEKLNFRNYTKRVNNHLIEELRTKKAKKTSVIKLNLSKYGDLCFRKLCYKMGQHSSRHNIVQILAKNNDYYPTENIALEIGGKAEQTIRVEIRKINNNILGKLQLKERVIEGRKGSGYRISPRYKIIIQK